MWRRLLILWSSPRPVLRRILALDDTPHAVALGAAVGTLFGMTPTVGLQTIEVLLFALLTRRLFYFNRTAALALIYISNPLTVAPIYYALYKAGTCFVPGEVTLRQFREILTFQGFAGWWQSVHQLVADVGLPLAVGTAVVAPVTAAVTYPVTRFLLQWYRGNQLWNKERSAMRPRHQDRPMSEEDHGAGDDVDATMSQSQGQLS
ncbi:MAG: DUF2062 domain-containing protein [Fuerstiella sp.]|nr:DUF2062 domain-containing protein [Fuerstiella sp.]